MRPIEFHSAVSVNGKCPIGNANHTHATCTRLVITGRVQGLGVRPAICRYAQDLGLGGSVSNTSRGVEIEVEGRREAVTCFVDNIVTELPQAAHVATLVREELRPRGRREFVILKQSAAGPLVAPVPEDRGVCEECLKDIKDLGDRRYGYPFTSCTQCGPRYTVIRAMPFERDATTLQLFPLCSDCKLEYEELGNRRFHAQTIACPICGPEIWSTPATGDVRTRGEHAIRAAVSTLLAGGIVGLRGLGGYQLLADATNPLAVNRLRERKRRPAKPLAVMVNSLEAAEDLAYFDDGEREAFGSPVAPIVLVRSRSHSGLVAAIAPQLTEVGLMRPTTPLHALLSGDAGRPLVCTSANREGDPLEYEPEVAQSRLADVCDLWIHHNRPIERPIDDSVTRVIAGRTVTLRLARGLAPLPLDLPTTPPILAVGGFLKSAVAWSNGVQATLGPHIGDQQSLATRSRWIAQVADWRQLYGCEPMCLVHDMHPEYSSTQWAQSQSIPTLAVQHHHAHIAAGMLEHGLLGRQVLGVAWDGTGYGTDGTIWGGEFLLGDDAEFTRFAHVRSFCLPGGEAAIREPWRIAVAICQEIDEALTDNIVSRWHVDAFRLSAVRKLASQRKLSVTTSSAGRLIDAAAALILGIGQVEFEGEAAMRLEAVADKRASGAYKFPLCCTNGEPELDWRPMFADLVADCRQGTDAAVMAMRFHRSLAQAIVEVCRAVPDLPVVVSGGVFQNRLLTELLVELSDGVGRLYLPGTIPPNDGGLAAGQLAVAAARLGRSPCV